MLGTGTDVTAFRLEDPRDLLLRDSIGGTAGEDGGVCFVNKRLGVGVVLEIRDHLPLARCLCGRHRAELTTSGSSGGRFRFLLALGSSARQLLRIWSCRAARQRATEA